MGSFDQLVLEIAQLRTDRRQSAGKGAAPPTMAKALSKPPTRLVLTAAGARHMRAHQVATQLDGQIGTAKKLMKSMLAGGRLTGVAACEAEARLHHLEALRAGIR